MAVTRWRACTQVRQHLPCGRKHDTRLCTLCAMGCSLLSATSMPWLVQVYTAHTRTLGSWCFGSRRMRRRPSASRPSAAAAYAEASGSACCSLAGGRRMPSGSLASSCAQQPWSERPQQG